ncbi:hypothetical protein [Alkaliphilus peptidifermentans]|uniref:hypothetical protein n=1 Tax=Alkaliphilus peptidifermentans TaxID=426129 RepID=UPI000B80E4A1|nr:hypothetical protein [Alkaliphilus peptidifermentans]
MYLNKISIGIWSQNIVALIISGFLSYLFLKEKPKISKRNSFGFIVPITIILLFLTILISTLFGNFPVPLMGYGISPIIGYFIAITWLLKVNTKVFKLQA